MTGIPEVDSEYPAMELRLRRARSRAGWLPGARGPACLTSPGWPWPLRLSPSTAPVLPRRGLGVGRGSAWVRWAAVVKYISNEQLVKGSQQFKQYNCLFGQFVQLTSLRMKYPFKRVIIMGFLNRVH